MKKIDLSSFDMKVIDQWANRWLLLTSGISTHFNSMTVGWGSIGVMWKKPFAQVVVRPGRYTYSFMNEYPTFTLCAFPEKYREALQIMGACSGRDVNKVEKAGLSPVPSSLVDAPSFAEASLVLECKKIYWDDFQPERFLEDSILDNYPLKDYHRIYYGEIKGGFIKEEI